MRNRGRVFLSKNVICQLGDALDKGRLATIMYQVQSHVSFVPDVGIHFTNAGQLTFQTIAPKRREKCLIYCVLLCYYSRF